MIITTAAQLCLSCLANSPVLVGLGILTGASGVLGAFGALVGMLGGTGTGPAGTGGPWPGVHAAEGELSAGAHAAAGPYGYHADVGPGQINVRDGQWGLTFSGGDGYVEQVNNRGGYYGAGAEINLMDGSGSYGDPKGDATTSDDVYARGGVSEGVGAAGRAYLGTDLDGDGHREYGAGADIGPLSGDIRIEDPTPSVIVDPPNWGTPPGAVPPVVPPDLTPLPDTGTPPAAEGSTTTPGADGTITVNHADGSTTTIYPGGGSATIAADGTSTTRAPDGTTYNLGTDGQTQAITSPDGTTAIYNSDGSVDVTGPDGTSSHQLPPATDGSHTSILPDGTTDTLHPDGTDEISPLRP